MLSMVIFEELLKLAATFRERNERNIFYTISLFGIWELILTKPIVALVVVKSTPHWSMAHSIFFIMSTLSAVGMHVLTAIIYGFLLRKSAFTAFLICCTIHYLYNSLVNLVFT